MLKAMLERRIEKLTKEEVIVICEITTDDIKLNRINFRKCTSLDYVLDIAEKSVNIFRKCA